MTSEFSDTMPPAPPGRFRDLIADTVRFGGARLVWVALVAAAAAAAEGTSLLLLLPLLSLLGIDGSEQATGTWRSLLMPFSSLNTALALYVAVVAAAAAVVALRGMLVSQLRNDFVDDLRARLHASLLSARWRVVARFRQAHLVHILTVEVARTGEGVQFLLRLAGWTLEVPVLVGVALALSPAMTALVLAFAMVVAFLVRPVDRMTQRAGRRLGPSGRRVLAAVSEDLANMAIIKCHGAEGRRVAHFAAEQSLNQSDRLDLERAVAMARFLTLTGGAAAVALVVWLGLRVLGLAMADTVVLVVAMARLLPLISRTHDGWRMVLRALPAHATARMLLADLAAGAEPAALPSRPVLSAAGPDVRLSGVTVHYRSGGPAALDDVSVTIPAGRHVAVVGASGAGKSTLALTLAGLLVPDAGALEVAGKVVDDDARIAWRRRTALVPQDPVLFNDTIANNLRLADPDASDGVLRDCLETADAGFVEALPDGLDTIVGDRGTALSGGERQRIALARALLGRPALLILDEPTAALDPAGEARVVDALRRRCPDTTVVTVSHRPALARAADAVIVLAHGKCLGQGSWDSLDDATRARVESLGL